MRIDALRVVSVRLLAYGAHSGIKASGIHHALARESPKSGVVANLALA